MHFSRSPTVHNLPPLFPLACKARKLRSCPHRFFARPVIPVAFTSSIAHASSNKAGKRSCNWALEGSCYTTTLALIMILNAIEPPISYPVGLLASSLLPSNKRCCPTHIVTRDSHLSRMFAEWRISPPPSLPGCVNGGALGRRR